MLDGHRGGEVADGRHLRDDPVELDRPVTLQPLSYSSAIAISSLGKRVPAVRRREELFQWPPVGVALRPKRVERDAPVVQPAGHTVRQASGYTNLGSPPHRAVGTPDTGGMTDALVISRRVRATCNCPHLRTDGIWRTPRRVSSRPPRSGTPGSRAATESIPCFSLASASRFRRSSPSWPSSPRTVAGPHSGGWPSGRVREPSGAGSSRPDLRLTR